jgi:signal transduction histidine kinase
VLVGQADRGVPSRTLERAAVQLREAIAELRELTEGIHPPSLTAHGLAAVVETLAERAPIPVRFMVPGIRWPAAIEQTAYFVISEALANVYKHAAATHATVLVAVSGDRVLVEITDDGRGGAEPGNGTGLRGRRTRACCARCWRTSWSGTGTR